MKINHGVRYQYVKIQGEPKRYFCLQQNPFFLAGLLFFKKNTLLPLTVEARFQKCSRQWMVKELRNYYSFARTNLSMLVSFLKHRYHLSKSDAMVELPFYGHICVLVNKGYKILDIRNGVAIKVYRNDVDLSTIAEELECLKNGSLFEFAPSVRRWNIEERWYEEDYISGSLDYSFRPRDSSAILKKFYQDVIPCLDALISYRPPIVKKAAAYADEMKSSFRAGDLLNRGLDVKKTDKVRGFIDSMTERILSERDVPVFLVLSHGDFCPANMLNTRQGLRIIDWESAASRSALFDFYSYFFFRPLHQKLSLDEFSSEIRISLPVFLAKLGMISPEISSGLRSSGRIYRWVFYIERICMLIEREKYDTKLNVMENILRYIEVFNCYEDIAQETFNEVVM